MFKLVGMVGKSYIVDMLSKNKDVQVIIYDDSVQSIEDSIIISPLVGFDEMLQGVCFHLAKEQRANQDLITSKRYLVIYTNLSDDIISKRERYIEEIEKQYQVNIVITCKPNRRY